MQCLSYTNNLCRSCALLDLTYADTLAQKENVLRSLFTDASLQPTVGLAHDADESRSKAKLAVFKKDGEIRFGFFNSSAIPQSLEECPLHMNGINSLLVEIRALLKKHQVTIYDLTNRKGELKYILLTKSDSHDEILVRFVLRSKDQLDAFRKITVELRAQSASVKVVTANIQPVHQAVLEGDEEIVLTENKNIHHRFDDFMLALGPRSFFQVTPEIARQLYQALASQVALDQPETLLDLYCGVGAFSFYAAKHCKQVTGIEISKEAIECARESVKLNGTANIDFFAQDAADYLNTTDRKFEAILVNPPRRGLNETIIADILKFAPKYIYYSSCNAETLARDSKALSVSYNIQSLQIFDMFPYTTHFETLMCLQAK